MGVNFIPLHLGEIIKGVYMRKNRYRDVNEALEILRRNNIAAEDKKIYLRPNIGIMLWGAVDYLVANGWKTIVK